MASVEDVDLVQRMRGEYLEMPGLSLTEQQAARLCGLRPRQCREVLNRLVGEGFLQQTRNGRYVRRDGQDQ
jgi:hypothetical protein